MGKILQGRFPRKKSVRKTAAPTCSASDPSRAHPDIFTRCLHTVQWEFDFETSTVSCALCGEEIDAFIFAYWLAKYGQMQMELEVSNMTALRLLLEGAEDVPAPIKRVYKPRKG